MKLLTKKDEFNTSGEIDSTSLLQGYVKLEDVQKLIEGFVDKEQFNKVLLELEVFDKEYILKQLLSKGIISINFPIQLVSTGNIKTAGTMYYDKVNDEWILNKKEKQIKL